MWLDECSKLAAVNYLEKWVIHDFFCIIIIIINII